MAIGTSTSVIDLGNLGNVFNPKFPIGTKLLLIFKIQLYIHIV